MNILQCNFSINIRSLMVPELPGCYLIIRTKHISNRKLSVNPIADESVYLKVHSQFALQNNCLCKWVVRSIAPLLDLGNTPGNDKSSRKSLSIYGFWMNRTIIYDIELRRHCHLKILLAELESAVSVIALLYLELMRLVLLDIFMSPCVKWP